MIHLNGGVSVAGNKAVVQEMHSRRKRVMTRKCVQTLSSFHVPHLDIRVEAATNHEVALTVELKLRLERYFLDMAHQQGIDAIRVSLEDVQLLSGKGVPND